jgi:hypothetical protein
LSCGVADTAILDPRLYPLVIGERVRDKIAKTQPDVRQCRGRRVQRCVRVSL